MTDNTAQGRPKSAPVVHKTPLYLCLFFLGLLLTGITIGEPARVMEQAWQICLSCIGIG